MHKSLFYLATTLFFIAFSGTLVEAAPNRNYENFTDARAMAAKEVLEYSLQQYQGETNTVQMYSSTELNQFVDQGVHLDIIEKRDHCQFTPDIEDRARIIGMPVFEYVFADMLINGRCVKQDIDLGLDYLNKSVAQGYVPALEKMSFYYEKGYFVSKNLKRAALYMKTAASLGSINARLGWADMLVRGFGHPSMYEEAYSWLYHSYYHDLYRRNKSEYIQAQLEKRMPPNIVARAKAYDQSLQVSN